MYLILTEHDLLPHIDVEKFLGNHGYDLRNRGTDALSAYTLERIGESQAVLFSYLGRLFIMKDRTNLFEGAKTTSWIQFAAKLNPDFVKMKIEEAKKPLGRVNAMRR